MANGAETTNSLLRQIVDLLQAQGQTLEGLQSSATRQEQVVTGSGGGAFGAGSATGQLGRSALGGIGLGGLASAIGGGPVGLAAYGISQAASAATDNFWQQRQAQYGTLASGYRGADPLTSQAETNAMIGFKQRQAKRIADFGANFGFDENWMPFGANPLDKDKRIAEAERMNLKERRAAAGPLFSAQYARDQAFQAFAPQVAQGGPVPTRDEFNAVEQRFKTIGDQMATLTKLANERKGSRVEAILKNRRR